MSELLLVLAGMLSGGSIVFGVVMWRRADCAEGLSRASVRAALDGVKMQTRLLDALLTLRSPGAAQEAASAEKERAYAERGAETAALLNEMRMNDLGNGKPRRGELSAPFVPPDETTTRIEESQGVPRRERP